MIKQDIYFAGTWLSDLGGRLKDLPTIEIAERDVELIEIPGRSGDIVLDKKRYKNVEFSREISLINRMRNTPTRDQIQKAISCFCYKIGYQEFRDTQHLGAFTKAILLNTSDVIRELPRFTTAELKFSRIPYWYTDEGQIWIYLEGTTTRTKEFYNPYQFSAEADYSITCSPGNTDIVINGVRYSATFTEDYDTFYVDTFQKQLMLINNLGDYKALSGVFPSELQPGNNTVSIVIENKSIVVREMKVKPNWRFL
ncbi:MAG: hypothetical protein ACI4HO_09080 [Ruminococcus sp.]